MIKTDKLADTSADTRFDTGSQRLVLCAALAAVLAWLLYRNLGLYPAIFADEWYYSKMARLMPLGEAIVPSYLYLWLFRGSLACGDGFLDCVRIANGLLFAGAGAFFYFVARVYMRPLLAIAVVVLSLLAPTNIYTAYFMPEATYYFGFAALSWVALTPRPWSLPRRALLLGVALGLMSLVKVHALFLIPATSLFLAASAWLGAHEQHDQRVRTALLAAAIAPLVALGIKFGLGFLIAGEPALSLFGSFYANAAAGTRPRSLLELLAPAFINGRGHLMALTVLMSLPLALLLHAVVSRTARQQAGSALNRLQLFAFLMLGSAAGMTIAYTASIAPLGPLEVVRLHLRYYTFVFPLLLILVASAMERPAAGARPPLGWLVALGLVTVLLFALVRLPNFSLNPVDGPEISGINLRLWTGWLVVGLDVLALGLWAFGSRLGAPLFLFGAMPVMLALGTLETNAYLAQLVPGWGPDHGGKYAHAHVPKQEHNQITVASTGAQEIMRAQFHIDAPDTAMLDLPPNSPIAEYQLPVRKKWLLVIGNHPLPPGLTPVKKTADYALVQLPLDDSRTLGTAELSKPFGTGLLADAQGLSHAEQWGRWSDAKQVVLHFNAPLPKNVQVILTARAFDVNATLPFTMRIGAESTRFQLSPSLQELGLRFVTDGKQRSLSIEVPRPISPADLGNPADARKLGIGIADITITDTSRRVQTQARTQVLSVP